MYAVYTVSVVVPARLERTLAEKLGRIVERGYYATRSDAVRDAVRRLAADLFSAVIRERLETVAKVSAAIMKRSAGSDATEIILFGSVARGEVSDDSDIDLLVLVQDTVDPDQMTVTLLRAIDPITLATDTVVTPTVMKRSEFVRMRRKGFAFAAEVERQAVPLAGGLLEGRNRAARETGTAKT